MKRAVAFILCGIVALSTSCNGNLYSVVVNPNGYGDQGFYEDMKIAMDMSNWTSALSYYSKLTPLFQSQRAVQNKYAGALAGACGFTFISFFQSLASASPGSGNAQVPLFLWLMQSFQKTTVTMAMPGGVTDVNAAVTSDTYCSMAQQVMDNIEATDGAWTVDEQIFVATFNLAKIGLILKYWLDPTGTGTPSNSQDVCSNAATGIPIFYMKQIVTGFALFLSNISAIAGVSASLSGINAACPALTALGINICTDTVFSTVVVNDEKMMRSLLSMEDSGTNPGNIFAGIGVYSFASAVPVANADPGANAWQCNGNAGGGVAACCPNP